MESVRECLRNCQRQAVIIQDINNLDKSNPVFKQLSKTNGLINSMSLTDLRVHLKKLTLDDRYYIF